MSRIGVQCGARFPSSARAWSLAASAPTIQIIDTFTAANGTAMSGRSPETVYPAATYSIVTGAGTVTAAIQSNACVVTCQNASRGHVLITFGSADMDATITGQVDNTDFELSLYGRYTDANNHWLVVLSGATFYLVEMTAGVGTVRASYASGYSAATNYTLRFWALGTSLKGYLDGTERLTYTSAEHQSATGIGFGNSNTTSAIRVGTFDNLSVVVAA